MYSSWALSLRIHQSTLTTCTGSCSGFASLLSVSYLHFSLRRTFAGWIWKRSRSLNMWKRKHFFLKMMQSVRSSTPKTGSSLPTTSLRNFSIFIRGTLNKSSISQSHSQLKSMTSKSAIAVALIQVSAVLPNTNLCWKSQLEVHLSRQKAQSEVDKAPLEQVVALWLKKKVLKERKLSQTRASVEMIKKKMMMT